MGMCKPSGGVEKWIGRVGDLTRIWKPNSRLDIYNETEKLLQQGWYDPVALIEWGRDWAHGGGEHDFPHDHYFDWGNKKKPRQTYIGPNGEKTNPNYC